MPGCRAEYRQKFKIKGFRFGGGEKACAMVAAVRGNEVQQMYVCALLVKKLRKLEEQGAIAPGNELLVVPCVNHFSMNVGSRFWAMDKTDINRMFPGYDQGETTQRIAAALFQAVQGYKYGIHFASFYLPGDFVPHVRIMNTGYQMASLGNLFGLPYADVVRVQDFYPRPPRGGRPKLAESIQQAFGISIHALREEGDSKTSKPTTGILLFLSTPSAKRATQVAQRIADAFAISIHALREEGDPRTARNFLYRYIISIHALREEGDHLLFIHIERTLIFLSTPSARRATFPHCLRPQLYPISIHALREEGDYGN